jgi:uncharacterized protein (TIGR03086 family)
MQTDDLVARAAAAAGELVRGTTPDQLGAPTPCRDWDVRALTNHLLQVVTALELAGRDAAVPGDLWTRDLMPADGFADRARGAAAAWARPGALDRSVAMGPMTMPAPQIRDMLVADLAIHGWDLACATGQPLACADAVGEAAERFVTATAEQGRSMGLFADAVPVPPGASALDRAVALSGRDPGWRAPASG